MYKKEFSENLTARTCCVCGDYWSQPGACSKCDMSLIEPPEMVKRLSQDEVLSLSASKAQDLQDYMEDQEIDLDDYRMQKSNGRYEIWSA